MAFDNYLKLGLDNRPVFHVPGAKRILFVQSTSIQSIVEDYQGAVEDVVLRFGEKWNLFNDLDNISYVLTPEYSKSGTLYAVEVAFTVAVQTSAKNSLFDAMRETDLTAVLQDRNNRWWLLGLEQPLRMTAQEQKVDNDTNQYTIKLGGRQRENVKEMSAVWIQTLPQLAYNDIVDAVDGATLGIKVETAINNNGSGTPVTAQLPNNFQNTIWGPPTGYVIVDTIGVVFANAGTTIKLPSTAVQNGQQHTVKDLSDSASVSTITIDGNGRLIDGFTTAKITTDGGSMTFTYQNNTWLITSFVN